MDKKIELLLSEKKLKITDARKKILKILLGSKKPLNYEQIKLNTNLNMDKATFYRNMQTFEKKSIVSKFESKDRVWHYEISKHNHAHFMCNECKKIECIDLKSPLYLPFHEIKNITLKGTCKECLEN